MESDRQKTLGAALIGVGRMGKVHLQHLIRNQRIQLLYIVDLTLDIVKLAMKEYGVNEAICKSETFEHINEVLEHPG